MGIKKLIVKKIVLNPHFIEEKLGISNTIEIVRLQGDSIEVIFKKEAKLTEETKQKILELINTPQYKVLEENSSE